MALAGSNRKPALTAAASKIGYSRQTAGKIKEASWQERAWQVYELEGSIYFMTRYRSAVARKVDYFAASVDSPGDDPGIDATYDDDGELLSLGPAAKVLEAEGGPELIRRIVSELMVHWDVPGEGYLTRFEEEPFWRILSTQELKKSGDAYSWGDQTTKMGTIDRDQVYRVWKAHPRFHWEADSPTKHILEDAEELILLRRELKARSLSRLAAGVWALPDTVDFSPFGEDEDGTEDDFAQEMTTYMSQAVKDPGSAASLVPWIITVSATDHAQVVGGLIRFDREWDINLDQRDALLRAIATGLDVPPEILTGMADLNHWSAWLVSEQAVSQHVAPTVDDILDSLTVNWFRPLLEASGVDPDGYVLWRDLSPATVPPDKTATALEMFRDGVISDIAVRRVSDFDEEDAPEIIEGETVMDADELLKRINALGTLRRAGADWESANAAVGLPPIELIPGLLPITVKAEEVVMNEAAPIMAGTDVPIVVTQAWLDAWLVDTLKKLQEGDPPLARAAVTAAVRRRIVATELADLDAELLAWVQDEADKEIARLVDLALTSAVDPLDESMLEGLASKLDKKIVAAQAAARSWLTRILGRTPSADGEDVARSQGVQVIIAGVLEAARRKLFTPQAAPDPIETGVIGNLTTPTQAIRHGLSLAGGGPAVYEDQKAAELIGNGQKVHDELAEDGFFQDGYEWKYGHPANTFEPHLHLDGKQFTSWDDPQLAVNFGDSWLRRSHYAPGDHKGCCCAFIQVIVEPVGMAERDEVTGDRVISSTTGGEANLVTNGMTPEEAATYVATRRDLTARYPDAASRVRHWGTGEDAQSLAALRAEIARIGTTIDPLDSARQKLIRETLEIIDNGGTWDQAYSRAYGSLESAGLRGLNLRNADGTSTIIVRPGSKPETAPWKVDTEWPAVRYTATHEFGHVIGHDWMTRLADRTPLAAGSEIEQGLATFQDAIVRAGYNAKVSDYGRTNLSEGLAELFVSNEVGGSGQIAFQLLADLAKQAEGWASWNARFPEASMRSIDWINLLLDIGEHTPTVGTFPIG